MVWAISYSEQTLNAESVPANQKWNGLARQWPGDPLDQL